MDYPITESFGEDPGKKSAESDTPVCRVSEQERAAGKRVERIIRVGGGEGVSRTTSGSNIPQQSPLTLTHSPRISPLPYFWLDSTMLLCFLLLFLPLLVDSLHRIAFSFARCKNRLCFTDRAVDACIFPMTPRHLTAVLNTLTGRRVVGISQIPVSR